MKSTTKTTVTATVILTVLILSTNYQLTQAQAATTFTELIKKIDPRTGQVSEEHPGFLKTGDAAWVRMEPLHPIAIEAFNDFPELGRFAIRDMGTTVAAGAVKEVTKKGP